MHIWTVSWKVCVNVQGNRSMSNKRYQASRVLVALFLFFFVICPLITLLIHIDMKIFKGTHPRTVSANGDQFLMHHHSGNPVIRIAGLCPRLVYEPFPYPASLRFHNAVHPADAHSFHITWDGAGSAVRDNGIISNLLHMRFSYTFMSVLF